MRTDGRKHDQLRDIVLTPNIVEHAEGSVLVEFGKTRVICTATYESQAPKWLQGSGQGWVTAEYGMIPRSTQQRIKRDKAMTGGRTQEISRLVGRSLRAAVDLRKMPDKQIVVDCDVIQADGGTRTASVTGGFVALALALKKLNELSEIKEWPMIHYVSAISVGMEKGKALLDMNYEEDSSTDTDMNFVMTDQGRFVELQGTAEFGSFSKEELDEMMNLAQQGCQELFQHQAKIIGQYFPLKR
jgi:ribonuclease PH